MQLIFITFFLLQVVRPDEDLDKFFTKKVDENEEIIDFDIEAFDAISPPTSNLGNLKKVKRPTRHPRSRNPVKALANRDNVKDSYHQASKLNAVPFTEETPKKKNQDVHGHLAAEAKAALAATEDFASVQLKKDNNVVPNAEFVPCKPSGNLDISKTTK